ncbi:hypothetical protein HXX02_00135 [Microbulbifer elongatus]|uniref:Uncharacterized protein n=1 Tax=Microbulbifer elongatus TaxID=86173 RepID=A0ABT1NVA9_9GAMM|nr:hypothetical protein [Microbulbifer elongatus]MCQ3827843.1 hypothetical protein [Microbulbifer elongatus]
MKYLVIALIFLKSSYVLACGERKIPIDISVVKVSEDHFRLSFKAPQNFEGYYILTAQYEGNGNLVPMYDGHKENEYSFYELEGGLAFFENSTITFGYGLKNTLCLHSESYDWEQVVRHCTEC